MEKGNAGDGKRLYVDVVALVVAIVSAVFSGWAVHRSNQIAAKTNVMFAEQLAIDRQPYGPVLEEWYYPALSLDVHDEEDKSWFRIVGLEPRPIRTTFWWSEYARYETSRREGYLFLIIGNRGGMALDMEISASGAGWVEKEGFVEPEGWSEIPDLESLGNGQAYALLVEAMESYDPFDPLAGAGWASVEVTVRYSDALGWKYEPLRVQLAELDILQMVEPDWRREEVY